MTHSIDGVDIGVVIGGGIRGIGRPTIITTLSITTTLTITTIIIIMAGIVRLVRAIHPTDAARIVMEAISFLRAVRLRQTAVARP